ncbi:MAG TPA: asparaginase [Advenella sp.]|nr:asparaginase [Advenella sp.]
MSDTDIDHKPIISIGALGGTISMTGSPGSQGVSSNLGAEELAQSVPGLAQAATLNLHTLARIASGSIRFQHLFDTLAWAAQQIDQGAQGVVITQGTDTLEESAFLLDLFWDRHQPLVLMGAMRNPQMPGADGSANLLAAVQVAADRHSCDRGVLVVMNDDIHEARRVRKMHTTHVEAFVSPVFGPVGVVQEGRVRYLRDTPAMPRLPTPPAHADKVLLLEHSLDDDPGIVSYALDAGYAGIVVAGFGSGHASEWLRDALVAAAVQVPVIMCSRTGAGSTTAGVYGYKGAEIDLQQHGVLMGGWLCPRKARLLLGAAIWNGLHRDAIHKLLIAWSQ